MRWAESRPAAMPSATSASGAVAAARASPAAAAPRASWPGCRDGLGHRLQARAGRAPGWRPRGRRPRGSGGSARSRPARRPRPRRRARRRRGWSGSRAAPGCRAPCPGPRAPRRGSGSSSARQAAARVAAELDAERASTSSRSIRPAARSTSAWRLGSGGPSAGSRCRRSYRPRPRTRKHRREQHRARPPNRPHTIHSRGERATRRS